MDNSDLEKRIKRLEDIEAIKQLKARYCAACDDSHNPEKLASLFATDGIWEGEGIGRYQGHAAIRALFEGSRAAVSFSQHNVMNPIIEIDRDRAKGHWYFFAPFTFRDGNRQIWSAARYEDDYVKIDGEWKFQHLRVFPRMFAPYETGWAKKESYSLTDRQAGGN